ncbi:MAG: hypothetical protein Kow0062_21730 [Acidobacteriota bacterium]
MRSRFQISLAVVVLFLGTALAAPLRHVRTETDVNWVSGGASGLSKNGLGVIRLSGINGPVRRAFLYWHGIDLVRNGGDGVYDNEVVTVNGFPVRGVPIGDGPTNLWGEGSSRAFRADITTSVFGDGDYVIAGLSAKPGHSANGVSMVVLFDDRNPANNRNLAFFEGNDANFAEGFPGETDGWSALLEPVIWWGGRVRVQLHVADGQTLPDDAITFDTGEGSRTFPDSLFRFDGKSVPHFGGSRTGSVSGSSNLWDIHNYSITSVMGDRRGRRSVRLSGQAPRFDGLALVLALVETEVQSGIDSVEFTQAIQEWQTLGDLKAGLDPDREPPVPLVAGKPTAVRVYFKEVSAPRRLQAQFEIPGVTVQHRPVVLMPNCSPDDQRRERKGCRSTTFYLNAPPGTWDATITISDAFFRVIEEHRFPLSSRDADELVLRSVAVCDSRDPSGTWKCAPRDRLDHIIDFLAKTAPTASVRVSDSGHTVRRDVRRYDADGDGTLSPGEMDPWWRDTVSEIGDLYGYWDRFLGRAGVQRYYYGMIRANLPGGTGGMADGIPSRGAASRISAFRLGRQTHDEIVAHETGHMLGRRHTGTAQPQATASPPGCYSLAADSKTDWPWADNLIRSGLATLEVGYDVVARKAIAPETHFDWMSYCTPRWVSPYSYRRAMEALGAGEAPARPGEDGTFWLIGGTIRESGVEFAPLFTRAGIGPADAGAGTHRIEVRDAGDLVLVTRRFTPREVQAEDPEREIVGPPRFFELVPVRPGAVRLVVLDDAGVEIGSLPLEGTAPTVAVLSPATGDSWDAVHEIRWSIDDPDSADHWSRIEYSHDDGVTWSGLATIGNETSLRVDSAALAGSTGSGRVRVLVSDGVNTGEAISGPFSVARKLPSIEIVAPQPGMAFADGDLVQLRAIAFDADDGFLDGASVVWTSDLAGEIGTGAQLSMTTLEPGIHEITATATDGDGQSATAAVRVAVASAAPTVTVELAPATPEPFSCVDVTIDARSADEVGLDRVEYSLDGGISYMPLAADRLPARFTIPGQGVIEIVARAYDTAGQLAATEEQVFIETPCVQDNVAPTAVARTGGEVECEDGAGRVTADGSGSFDPDGDELTCSWSSASCSFADPAACTTEARCPLGESEVSLTVSDGTLESAPDVAAVRVVDTQPPAGRIVFPEDGACLHGPVTVVDDFTDRCEPDLARRYEPPGGPVYDSEGPFEVTLVVSDSAGNTSSAMTGFTIDDTPPVVRLVPPVSTQTVPRTDPISAYLATSDADAAPGGVVGERILVDDCVALDGATWGDGDGLLTDETIDVPAGLLCLAYEACGLTRFVNPVVTGEARDCAGNIGRASVPVPGTYVIDPSACPQ